MASRSKATIRTHSGTRVRDARSEKQRLGTGTREAIRDILRRYRETFERLGR